LFKLVEAHGSVDLALVIGAGRGQPLPIRQVREAFERVIDSLTRPHLRGRRRVLRTVVEADLRASGHERDADDLTLDFARQRRRPLDLDAWFERRRERVGDARELVAKATDDELGEALRQGWLRAVSVDELVRRAAHGLSTGSEATTPLHALDFLAERETARSGRSST
jgi:hypothetical protein